jgi:hypothetical protein
MLLGQSQFRMAFPSRGQPADYGQEWSDDSLRYGFHPNADTCRVDTGRLSCYACYRGFSTTRRNYKSSAIHYCFYLLTFEKYLPVASLDSLKELDFVRPGVLKDIMMSMSSKGILQGKLTFLVGPPFPFSQTISVYNLCQKWFLVLLWRMIGSWFLISVTTG